MTTVAPTFSAPPRSTRPATSPRIPRSSPGIRAAFHPPHQSRTKRRSIDPRGVTEEESQGGT
ncbi:hypothetical protein Zm00014a_022206 [Zea mays]|uniref:Uncharacterized protein n=1 Tax=Zea mays TaxID=4577 RepID=A0A3L6EFW9_MAIZE|nr:hypothetical protein Zm00014a_022206 [Zea mays]